MIKYLPFYKYVNLAKHTREWNKKGVNESLSKRIALNIVKNKLTPIEIRKIYYFVDSFRHNKAKNIMKELNKEIKDFYYEGLSGKITKAQKIQLDTQIDKAIAMFDKNKDLAKNMLNDIKAIHNQVLQDKKVDIKTKNKLLKELVKKEPKERAKELELEDIHFIPNSPQTHNFEYEQIYNIKKEELKLTIRGGYYWPNPPNNVWIPPYHNDISRAKMYNNTINIDLETLYDMLICDDFGVAYRDIVWE